MKLGDKAKVDAISDVLSVDKLEDALKRMGVNNVRVFYEKCDDGTFKISVIVVEPDDKSEGEVKLDIVNEFIRKMKASGRVINDTVIMGMKCRDGFTMSVQASRYHYCSPRDDVGPYSEVEVGYPSSREELLMPYAEEPDKPTDTVYSYVPIEVVAKVVEKHGGIVWDLGGDKDDEE